MNDVLITTVELLEKRIKVLEQINDELLKRVEELTESEKKAVQRAIDVEKEFRKAGAYYSYE
jgi:chaperonin cofactor prefoldin